MRPPVVSHLKPSGTCGRVDSSCYPRKSAACQIHPSALQNILGIIEDIHEEDNHWIWDRLEFAQRGGCGTTSDQGFGQSCRLVDGAAGEVGGHLRQQRGPEDHWFDHFFVIHVRVWNLGYSTKRFESDGNLLLCLGTCKPSCRELCSVEHCFTGFSPRGTGL